MPLCGRRGTTLNNFSNHRLDLSPAPLIAGLFLCVPFGKCLDMVQTSDKSTIVIPRVATFHTIERKRSTPAAYKAR